jgi:hypothetical protein
MNENERRQCRGMKCSERFRGNERKMNRETWKENDSRGTPKTGRGCRVASRKMRSSFPATIVKMQPEKEV